MLTIMRNSGHSRVTVYERTRALAGTEYSHRSLLSVDKATKATFPHNYVYADDKPYAQQADGVCAAGRVVIV